jgi:hypothetical protein
MLWRHKCILQALLLSVGLCLLLPVRVRASELPLEILGTDVATKKAATTQLKTALAADPKNRDLRIRLGTVLCELGGDGDETSSDAALALFKAYYAEAPADAEVRAFYGSACTIHAKYVFLFFKPGWADQGFAHLDAAVAAAPDDINVRLIRAFNSSQVPAFLGRDKVAREDFAWLLLRRQAHPEEFSPMIERALYYYAGRYALDRADAQCVGLLTQAAAVPGTVPLCAKIQTALQQAHAKFPKAAATSSSSTSQA